MVPSLSVIRSLVAAHYGVRGMPMRVLKKADEVLAFEAEHPEVPPMLWEFVNHDIRLVRMWARADLCLDLVVFHAETQTYQMIQDVCFVDAYPDATAWHRAVFDLVKANPDVWVVTHGDDLPSSTFYLSAWS